MTQIKTLEGKTVEMESLFPNITDIINPLVYDNSGETGPLRGGLYTLWWDESEIRGTAYAETENYRVYAVNIRHSFERETKNPHPGPYSGGDYPKYSGLAFTRMGWIRLFYVEKEENEVKHLTTPSITVESLQDGRYSGSDLKEFYYVGIDSFSNDTVEVAWLDHREEKGPAYRINLQNRSVDEIK